MQRFQQLVFVISLLALSWFVMMVIHESGHVAGALVTGGTIQRVVVHPLTISRTNVSPNPIPSVVVWLGPIMGSIIPLVIWLGVPARMLFARQLTMFFAGFCLVANGAYVAFGSLGRVGDCGEMLQTGTPLWALWLFGAVTIPLGLYLWHRLGSLKSFLADPSIVGSRSAYITLLVAMAVAAAACVFSANQV